MKDFNLTHPVTIRRLEQDLLTKSLLFIGYSYKDPNIQSIINNVRQMTDGKSQTRHYMILSTREEKRTAKNCKNCGYRTWSAMGYTYTY